MAHGWWMKDGQKISKSAGNALEPREVVENFSLDAFRFFLCRESNIMSDGNYSDPIMVAHNNADLADDLGNLVRESALSLVPPPFYFRLILAPTSMTRILAVARLFVALLHLVLLFSCLLHFLFVAQFCRCISTKLNPEMRVPRCGPLTGEDEELVKRVAGVPALMDFMVLHANNIQQALIGVSAVITDVNRFVTQCAPWKLVSAQGENPEAKERLVCVCMCVSVCVCLCVCVCMCVHVCVCLSLSSFFPSFLPCPLPP